MTEIYGGKYSMNIAPTLDTHIGVFTLTLRVTDSDSVLSGLKKFSEQTFEINIELPPEKEEEIIEGIDFEIATAKTKNERPEPRIVYISREGLVEIEWDQTLFSNDDIVEYIN